MGGIASLARRSTSFLQNRVGLNSQHVMLGLGAVALNPGTEKFVSGIAGDKAGTAFSSASSGGLVGASLGSLGGPMGTALGGLGGAALGAVKALESFEKNLLSDKIEKGFAQIEDAASDLASALEASGGKISKEVLAKADTVEGHRLANRNRLEQFKGATEPSMSESYGHVLSGIGGGFMNLFDSTKGKSLSERFSSGYNAPAQAAEKGRQSEILEKELADLRSGADSDTRLRSGLLGESKKAGDYSQSFHGQAIQEREARSIVLGREQTGESDRNDRLKNLEIELSKIRQRDFGEEKSGIAGRAAVAAYGPESKPNMIPGVAPEHQSKVRAEIERRKTQATSDYGNLYDSRNKARESADAVDSLHFNTQHLIASQKAERLGGDISDHLPLSAHQAPFLASQQRLTGLKGSAALNPLAVNNRIQALTGKVGNLRGQVDKGEGGLKAIADLAKFDDQLKNAIAGLKNLADSSKLSAGAVERLGRLKGDQQSRMSMSEQYMTATPDEKKEMDRQAKLAKQIHQSGIESIKSPEDRKAGMSFLRNAGNAQLFGGKLSGPEIADNAIKNSDTYRQHFAPSAANQKEMRGLENSLVANSQRAEQAGALMAGVHAGEANAFAGKIGAAAAEGASPLLAPKLPIFAQNPVPELPGRPMIFAPEGEIKDSRTKKEKRSDALAARKSLGEDMADLRGSLAKAKTPAERKSIMAEMDSTRGRLADVKGILNPDTKRSPEATAKATAYQTAKTERRNAYLEKHGNTVLGKAYAKTKTAEAEQAKEKKPAGSDFLEAFKGAGDTFKSSSAEMLTAANTLAEAIKGMPHTITLEAKATHEHVHNGQSAINEATPTFQKMIEESSKRIINETLSRHFPDAAPFN